MSTALTHQTLKEIADRIHAHLKRLEAQECEQKKRDGTAGDARGSFWCSSAQQAGTRVRVTYITYQGGTNLTRAEALHYLAGLDSGFQGRHHEYFRQSPVPQDADAEIRFTALVHYRGDWCLYGVTKRTEARVYGRGLAGRYAQHLPTFLERRAVHKLRATQEDLERVLAAEKRLKDATHAAQLAYQRELATIIGKGGENGE